MENSPQSGKASVGFSSGSIKSKSDICPVSCFLRSAAVSSTIAAYACIICLRVPGRLSNAPALMKFSMVRLFASLPFIRVMKSVRDVNGPLFSRSLTIASITCVPRPRIAERP